MEKADLHIHSTFSDGLLSPEQIIEWALEKRLTAISITDHDTIDGIHVAVEYSKDRGIEVIPGIELSTEYNNAEVHILGYFINYKDSGLVSFLKKLKDSRFSRVELIIKKLKTVGVSIDISDIYKEAGDASSIGRPHIARILVKKDYCSSVEEAFCKYLEKGKPAFVERYKISPFEAVELISKYKGVSSLAHPGLVHNINITELAKRLKVFGLSAIEVYHTSHSSEQNEFFLNLSQDLELIPTGGTDCHGTMYEGEPLLGNIYVPYENVKKLHEKTIG